jgi:hypothetical protein
MAPSDLGGIFLVKEVWALTNSTLMGASIDMDRRKTTKDLRALVFIGTARESGPLSSNIRLQHSQLFFALLKRATRNTILFSGSLQETDQVTNDAVVIKRCRATVKQLIGIYDEVRSGKGDDRFPFAASDVGEE